MKTNSPEKSFPNETSFRSKVLVTGGSGFLGRYIIRDLLATGRYEVYCFSRTAPSDLMAQHIAGNLKNKSEVFSAIKGMDAVIHTASKVGMGGNYQDYYETNVIGTENVIEACQTFHVKSLIYTSTPSVAFGNTDLCGIDEDSPLPSKYLSYYAETKALAEKKILSAHGPTLKTLSIRPHLIFGPGDQNLIPRVLKKARKGQLKIVGNGKNLVDVTYVENASYAHLLALSYLENMATDAIVPGQGQAYFLGQGPVYLWDFINQILTANKIPTISKKIPFKVVYTIGFILEKVWAHLILPLPKSLKKNLNLKEDPPMSRFIALQLGKSHYFNCQKIENDLQYRHLYTILEGIQKLLS